MLLAGSAQQWKEILFYCTGNREKERGDYELKILACEREIKGRFHSVVQCIVIEDSLFQNSNVKLCCQ
jgi:hypothetical protein